MSERYAQTRNGLFHELTSSTMTVCGRDIAPALDAGEMTIVSADVARAWLSTNTHDLCCNCKDAASQS